MLNEGIGTFRNICVREIVGKGQIKPVLFSVFKCIYVPFTPGALSAQRDSREPKFFEFLPNLVSVPLLVPVFSILLFLELRSRVHDRAPVLASLTLGMVCKSEVRCNFVQIRSPL